MLYHKRFMAYMLHKETEKKPPVPGQQGCGPSGLHVTFAGLLVKYFLQKVARSLSCKSCPKVTSTTYYIDKVFLTR